MLTVASCIDKVIHNPIDAEEGCLVGVQKIINSDIVEPINLGSGEAVSINQLIAVVEEIAGIRLQRKYDLDAPQGVNGCNSDNALIQSIFTGSRAFLCRLVWRRRMPGFTTSI